MDRVVTGGEEGDSGETCVCEGTTDACVCVSTVDKVTVCECVCAEEGTGVLVRECVWGVRGCGTEMECVYGAVCLLVCQSVSRITQQLLTRFP